MRLRATRSEQTSAARQHFFNPSQDYAEKLRPYVIDQVPLLKSAKAQNANILVEGANALMLDIDAGSYPFVTSSNTGLGKRSSME